jgi:hypothetical protein
MKLKIRTHEEDTPFLWIDVSWDETPLNLKFGQLDDILRPVARYWYQDAIADASRMLAPSWKLLTHDEFQRRGLGRKVDGGVLQVMGLMGTISWPSWEMMDAAPDQLFLEMNRHKVNFPPKLLPTNDSSTIAQALDDSLGELKWEKILPLIRSGKLRFLVLSLTADLDGANVRTKHFFGTRVKEENAATVARGHGAYVLLIDAACTGHILNSFTTHAFKASALVPKLHSVCFTLNDVKRWGHIVGVGLPHCCMHIVVVFSIGESHLITKLV